MKLTRSNAAPTDDLALDQSGGLNGSMQQLLEVFVVRVCEADFVHERGFKRNTALFRF